MIPRHNGPWVPRFLEVQGATISMVKLSESSHFVHILLKVRPVSSPPPPIPLFEDYMRTIIAIFVVPSSYRVIRKVIAM